MGQDNSKDATPQDGSPDAEGMKDVVVPEEVKKGIADIYQRSKEKVGSAVDNDKSLHDNYNKLKEEVKKLSNRRDEVVVRINGHKSKQASRKCNEWIDEAKILRTEVDKLIPEFDKEMKHYGPFRFLNRSTLSERIMKLCKNVQSCWERGISFLTEALVDKPPEPVIKIENAPNIENLPTFQGIIENVLERLVDKDMKRIGLSGNVGAGKSAILENLNNSKQVATMFDLVIFATLPTKERNEEADKGNEEKFLTLAVKKLQLQIAQRLKLESLLEDTEDTKTIASGISKKLESERYLLILDEVWSTFSLDAIGIRENGRDSKVVLASRDPDICCGMKVDKPIPVIPLSDTEALKLFFEKLDSDMNQTDIAPIARLVIRECGHLPFVIDRVAGTFRRIENNNRQRPQQQTISLWRAALDRLRKWPKDEVQGMNEFLEKLRYCYEELDGEDKKKGFLYGALYPNGYDIYVHHLLECWRAEGIIGEADQILDVHNGGLFIIQDLIKASLLEDSEKMNHIRMNKVLRSLALKILSERTDLTSLVRAGEDLVQPPGETEWSGVKWISLMDNNLRSLPGNPGCNSLSTLLLQGNDHLTSFPDLFFQAMQGLCVLNLHGTGITTLPESISLLTALRVLYLNSCNQLKKLPPEIALLVELEVLDIWGTGIDCLPAQINRLHKLRCLRMSLSNISVEGRNVAIDEKIISELRLLEELWIDVHPQNEWWNNEVVVVVSREVVTMKNLNSLSLCFPGVGSFENFIRQCAKWKELFKFHFSVGQYHSIKYKVFDYFENESRCLKYANGESTTATMSEVLAEANAFELLGHKGPSKLSDFGIDKISNIKTCVIESCLEMQTIVDATRATTAVLGRLEKMYVSDLPRLERMWVGVVPSGSLAQLTTLSFFECTKLKKIFSRGMIQQLAQLQHLEVKECKEIEDIVESPNDGPQPSQLPSLKKLNLHDLDKLRCSWTASFLMSRSLESCEVSGCPLLEQLLSQ